MSFLLTVVLVLSGTSLTAFASENPKEDASEETLVLVSSTADTIVLKAEDGYEYAIGTEDEDEDEDEMTWQWAEPEQYTVNDETGERTVSFTGLQEQTEYTFARRVENDEKTEITGENIKTFATAAIESTAESEETKAESEETEAESEETKAETEETKAESKETKAETEETKAKSEETKAESQETKAESEETKAESEETKAESEETKAESKETKAESEETKAESEETKAESEETKAESQEIKDVPQKIKAPANTSVPDAGALSGGAATSDVKDDQTDEETPEVKDAKTDDEKAASKKPEIKAKPVLETVTDTEITVKADGTDDKYAYEFSIDGGKTYVDDGKFTGLQADTQYLVTMRIKAGKYEGQDFTSSAPSGPLTVHTLKSAAAAPAAPAVERRTDTEITFASADGLEYGRMEADGTVTWQKSGSFTGLTAGTEYRFVFRAAYDPAVSMPGISSDAVAVRTLKAAAAAPAAPDIKERTETSITVEAVSGQEYALWTDGKAGTWQTGGEFKNLASNTAYAIVTRVAYNAEESMESRISEPVNTKTFISFSGSAVAGIQNGATYDAGSSFTATASGNGMDNTAPAIGDSRWKPLRWLWGSGSGGSWSSAPYATAFSVKEAGKYTLNVVFGLETYTQNGWESTGKENTLTTSFNVVAKEFIIKATVTKGGTISPAGSVKVTQGKDYTFTMTPDKNHKIYKVYIDGRETTVNGAKYTFTGVQADHTIHVVFEKSQTMDTPKTGEDFQPWILWTVAGICAAAIVIVLIVKICLSRKRKN